MKIEVTPAQLPSVLLTCFRAGNVPFVLGAPGLGKSSIAAQVAAEAGRDLWDVRLNLFSPSDIAGFLYLGEQGTVRSAVPPMLPFHGHPRAEAGKALVLLDEINTAATATQNVGLQLALDKRVGEHSLVGDTWIMAAGNRKADKATINSRMSAALMNRFVTVHLRPDLDSWSDWAAGNGVSPEFLAYVNFRPEHLHNMPDDWDGESNFPSPRSLAAADREWRDPEFRTLPETVKLALIAGHLGQAVAVDLISFLQVWQSLPDYRDILKHPDTTAIPYEPSARVATACMVANRVEGRKEWAAATTYLKRLPKSFEVLGIRLAVRRDRSLMATPEFMTWVVENPDVIGLQ